MHNRTSRGNWEKLRTGFTLKINWMWNFWYRLLVTIKDTFVALIKQQEQSSHQQLNVLNYIDIHLLMKLPITCQFGIWSANDICSNGETRTKHWWTTHDEPEYQPNYNVRWSSACDGRTVSVASVNRAFNIRQSVIRLVRGSFSAASKPISQPNTLWKTLDELYQICIVLHVSKHNNLRKCRSCLCCFKQLKINRFFCRLLRDFRRFRWVV